MKSCNYDPQCASICLPRSHLSVLRVQRVDSGDRGDGGDAGVSRNFPIVIAEFALVTASTKAAAPTTVGAGAGVPVDITNILNTVSII